MLLEGTTDSSAFTPAHRHNEILVCCSLKPRE